MRVEQILEGLNNEQEDAVLSIDGPLLILAGAGSGKTRVITRRIAWGLSNRTFRQDQFLAVTFTNKAAREMRERVEQLTGRAAKTLWIKTFHSTGASILREFGHKLNITRYFTIYDTQDCERLLKQLLKDYPSIMEKYAPSLFLNCFAKVKQQGMTIHDVAAELDDGPVSELLPALFDKYENRLRENQAVDFADLLYLPLRLWLEHPEVLQEYRRRFPYVLVDEYQDTNRAQYMLIKLLTEEHRNICVVGDDDQSIYNWRGADVSNILQFQNDYPECKVVRLEQNYRSTPQILEVARHVIKKNEYRMSKEVWSNLPDGNLPTWYFSQSDRDEAAYIALMIERYQARGFALDQLAVFYRTNWQSRIFEETLIKARIPYHLVGSLRFYERKEIKELVAYLRLLVNPKDEAAFIRAVSVPSRGAGEKTRLKIIELARKNDIDLLAACADAAEAGVKGKKTIKYLSSFNALFVEARNQTTIHDQVLTLLEDSGLQMYYIEESERLGNLLEFSSGVFEYQMTHPEDNLGDYMQELALLGSSEEALDANKRSVQLMTIHNAKGLEFDVVFLTGLEQNMFPHRMALDRDDDNVEEERRLFYVGVTRAKRFLHMTSSQQRYIYGRLQFNPASQFITEIPEELIQELTSDDILYGSLKPENNNSKIAAAPQNILLKSNKKQTEEKTIKEKLNPGDRVKHPEYGEGTVVETSLAGNMLSIRVDFGDRQCRFLEKYSQLERIG